MPTDSFTDVMLRLRAGDPAAVAALFGRFTDQLVRLARERIGARLQGKVDAEDVLQSVYRTFFRRHAEGQFHLDGWDGLWSLLTLLTLRKCRRWRQYFYAASRDVRAEVALGAHGSDEPTAQCFDREPAPDEAAALADLVESLLRCLNSRDRQIVSLRLQQWTPGETAEQLRLPERTVFRVLEHVRERLRRMFDETAMPE
jgi:RNA polymerase sigma-70 factor (ECF subfamily)